jgi:hypothetical protein
MGDRLELLIAIVIGGIGLVMLAELDVPVIRHGGWTAGAAAVELSLALLLLCTAVVLHARET